MNALVTISPAVAPVTSLADRIGATAAQALRLELETWPKPGLVSLVDTGSHDDMDAATFHRSIAVLEPFLAELGAAGAMAARMPVLRRVGLAAEAAMLAATGGINTHRGAIFGLGLLCAAGGAPPPHPANPVNKDDPRPPRGPTSGFATTRGAG